MIDQNEGDEENPISIEIEPIPIDNIEMRSKLQELILESNDLYHKYWKEIQYILSEYDKNNMDENTVNMFSNIAKLSSYIEYVVAYSKCLLYDQKYKKYLEYIRNPFEGEC